MMRLQEIAQVLDGIMQGDNVEIQSVDTDSRRVIPGQLFVALDGARFDGHDFLPQVMQQGAVAALVSKKVDSPLPTVKVADTRLAIGKLSAYWRRKWGMPLIAVTGSNGKTTTKEMISAIMQQCFQDDAQVLSTAGNFNNDIGLPLTLLRLRSQHRIAVIEMGMNHLGEIDYLTRLATPEVALINNAGTAHIGELGSRENIAKAKGEIFNGLSETGIAVFNADSAFAGYWQQLNVGRRTMTFGLKALSADVVGDYQPVSSLSSFTLHYAGQSVQVHLSVPGEHNVMNALAAATASLAAGATLEAVVAGLEKFNGVSGRLQLKTALNGAQVIDDTYNANPDSMKAALAVLRSYDAETWFVMGDMGELGEEAEAMHRQIGAYAKTCGIRHFIGFGAMTRFATAAYGSGAQHFETLETLINTLQQALTDQDVVLIKGSRFMQMERVVNGLVKAKSA